MARKEKNRAAAKAVVPPMDNLHLAENEPCIFSHSSKPSSNPAYPGVELMTFQGWTREPKVSRFSITRTGKQRFWCMVTTKDETGEPVNLDVVFWDEAAEAMKYLVQKKGLRLFLRLREALVSPAYEDPVSGEIRNPTYNINFLDNVQVVEKEAYEDETTRMIREMQEADKLVEQQKDLSEEYEHGQGLHEEDQLPF